jgi:protein-tyrosine phosphatase
LEGAFNCRDLGGLRTRDGGYTRPGVLYRSDSLDLLTAEDLVELERRGVRTIVDLRTDDETKEMEAALVRGGRPARHHLPLIVEGAGERVGAPEVARGSLAERYLWYLDTAAPAVLRLVELIADRENHALVFHCTAGKDRTGVVAALLLETAGVEVEPIVDDYVASQAGLPQVWERLRAHPRWGPRMKDVDQAAFRVERHTMLEFISELQKRFGGARQWLLDAGADEAAVVRLARLLVAY